MREKLPANIPALTTDQMKEVDRLMVEEYRIELDQMMENAGRNLAELARRISGGSAGGKSITVLCGTGNNGGGGMAAARHLHNRGSRVRVILTGDAARLKGVAARQWESIQKIGLAHSAAGPSAESGLYLAGADLLLDAMLGYGAEGDPRPPLSEWIEQANLAGVPILSLDAPSGLDMTTGRPGIPCICAAATLTLALPKAGLLASRAKPFVGQLYLADIGVPGELYASPSLALKVDTLFAEDSIIRLW
ncbi:MAG: NAD(P)H-hydrate epimerase [Bacteroidota bacterium]